MNITKLTRHQSNVVIVGMALALAATAATAGTSGTEFQGLHTMLLGWTEGYGPDRQHDDTGDVTHDSQWRGKGEDHEFPPGAAHGKIAVERTHHEECKERPDSTAGQGDIDGKALALRQVEGRVGSR
jgi:hypothetical protein